MATAIPANSIASFVPSLFIGVGPLGCFFTLRMTHLAPIDDHGGYKISSHHITNLCQDPSEAYEKAMAFANKYGTPLTTTRASLANELNEIRRSSRESIERRRAAKEEEDREREMYLAHADACREDRDRFMISHGHIPFGEHVGKTFDEAPRGYVTWLIESLPTFAVGSVIHKLAVEVKNAVGHRAYPSLDPDLHIGSVGERVTLDVTVTRVISVEGFYGRCYIVTMIEKATNACIVSKSGAFCPADGSELTIKATVKAHDRYRDQAQTVVQRVAVQKR